MKLSTVLRRMKKSKLFLIGFGLLFIIVAACFTSRWWVYWDSETSNLLTRLEPPDYVANGLEGRSAVTRWDVTCSRDCLKAAGFPLKSHSL